MGATKTDPFAEIVRVEALAPWRRANVSLSPGAWKA